MVRKIFFYTVSVHHRPTSSSSSSSTLVFTPASSFVLLCTARGFISPHHTPHPPSSSTRVRPSNHLPAIFNIDSTSRRQIVFLPLRDRRSLVCSQSTSLNVTTFISTPP